MSAAAPPRPLFTEVHRAALLIVLLEMCEEEKDEDELDRRAGEVIEREMAEFQRHI